MKITRALAVLAGAGLTAAPSMADPRTAPEVRIAFAPSSEDIANPERGFYRAGDGNLDRLDRAYFDRAYADGYRLIYARIDLSGYRERPLPSAFLGALTAWFAAARQAGVKLIVRAVYNYPRGETGYQSAQDAALPVVLTHLRQLKPLFAANADVVAFVQAGFIGAWGEWHTSSNGLTTPAARARIRDALLAAVPADRFVQFRYPPDLVAWTPVLPARGRALRTGFHNDCFLASQTDVGTYPEETAPRDRVQAHMAALTALAPFGGETCNPADDPGALPRTGCDDIRREGGRYHLTYLNANYYRRLFHDRWTAEGCMDEVRRRMGYRFILTGATVPAQVRPGEPWRLEMTVRNDGWARLFNPRGVELLLLASEDGEVRRFHLAGIDPREWLPGTTTRVPLRLTLPAALPAGRYEIALALPDAAVALRRDPRYAIRFANADAPDRGQSWDAALGAFRIGAAVTVGAPARQARRSD